jgi:SAM-dependent methyltransferase
MNESLEDMDHLHQAMERRLKFAHFPYLKDALLKERARVGKEITVLDVGCGPGNLPAFCHELDGCRWFGMDLWVHQLTQASEKRTYDHLFQVNLVEGLPCRKDLFDVVVCNEVLKYLPNALQMLGDIHRVLRPYGIAFIYNPISWTPGTFALLKRWSRKIYQESDSISLDTQTEWKKASRAGRITYYSYGSLIRDIQSSNFLIADVTGFRLFRGRVRLMNRLEHSASSRSVIKSLASRFPFLASDLMVAARKSEKDIPTGGFDRGGGGMSPS